MLTEEALEGGNKDLKNFELNHSMHTTPEQALRDVFHRLMRRSDPIIQVRLVLHIQCLYKLWLFCLLNCAPKFLNLCLLNSF